MHNSTTDTSLVNKPTPTNNAAAGGVGGRRGRRVKVKAAAETNTNDSTEQPGECAQS